MSQNWYVDIRIDGFKNWVVWDLVRLGVVEHFEIPIPKCIIKKEEQIEGSIAGFEKAVCGNSR